MKTLGADKDGAGVAAGAAGEEHHQPQPRLRHRQQQAWEWHKAGTEATDVKEAGAKGEFHSEQWTEWGRSPAEARGRAR